MTLGKFLDWFSDRDERPNKFTIYVGNAIKKAREEAGLSQDDLAKKIYHRRASLSEYEAGKSQLDAETLCLLAYYLDKPIAYFLPPFMYQDIKQEGLSAIEQSLILQFRKIWDEHLQGVAIQQVRVLADFDPTTMLWDLVDFTVDAKEQAARLEAHFAKRQRERKGKS